MTAISSGSLPLCAVLEAEFAALSGVPTPPASQPHVDPSQILDVHALAQRLIEGNDALVVMLRHDLLVDAITGMVDAYRTNATRQLTVLLARALNQLIDDPRCFDAGHRRFYEGIRFRSQTVDRIAAAPDAMLHRLLIEDAFPEIQKIFDLRLAKLFASAHRQQFHALCLSGGGIRSATFALGVIEGMARHGLLAQFDYLSTVSGGGYTGSWLSAWIARTSFAEVAAQLGDRPRRPREPDAGPVQRLRAYSNYLTPRLGVLSADAWTLGATYLRNLLLNWIAFIPPLIALVTLPLLLVALLRWQPVGAGVTAQYVAGLVLMLGAVIAAVMAVRYVHANRPRQVTHGEGARVMDEKRSQRDFLRECLLPLLFAVNAASICWMWGSSYASPAGDLFRQLPAPLALGIIGAIVHTVGWALAMQQIRRNGDPVAPTLKQWLVAPATGFALGTIAAWLSRFAPPLWQLTGAGVGRYAWLSTPALLLVIMLASHLYVGYTSRSQSDAEREWSARFTGWLLIALACWFIGVGLVVCGPVIVEWLVATWSLHGSGVAAWGISVVAASAGVGATVTAKSPRTPVVAHAGVRNALALTLACVFFGWLVVALSGAGAVAVEWSSRAISAGTPESTSGLIATLIAIAALALFGLASSACIDVNMFSLHAMYRARLIRAYLGASRGTGDRDPNRFTGFDDQDNIYLRELWPQPAPRGGNRRPLHIINATLNLVTADNLAWQERKAESFTFSPLHCGSANVGYRPTQDDPRDPSSGGYGGELGVTLGTAMAISGAAASPDMGYHSSPVLSLLLTFFNVRLGWWLGNPGHAGRRVFRRSRPVSSLRPLLDEALGRTDDRNAYVYLSDGGHFENLGLYEMVLRRCQVIVVCDASSDPGASFADLGNAIRKIRIDLGIPIDIDTHAMTTTRADGTTVPAKSSATGLIRYRAIDDGAPDGILVYLKPAISPSAAADVLAYARSNLSFPHETTADQWFTESQFESYRRAWCGNRRPDRWRGHRACRWSHAMVRGTSKGGVELIAFGRHVTAARTLPVLAGFFIYAGIMHFVRPAGFIAIVPPQLPAAALLVAVSGGAEIAGGIGVCIATTKKLAATGLILLLIAVFPANIYMLAHAMHTGSTPLWIALLWLRLPFQPLMIWWLWRGAVRPAPR